MRTATLAAALLTIAVAGCAPPHVSRRAVTRLDCPKAQGDLKRVSVAADGKSCRYTTDEGAQVELRLIPVTGDVKTTLAALEAEVLKLRGTALPVEPASEAAEGAARDAAATVAQAEADAGPAESKQEPKHDSPGDENVDIDMPGLRIRAHGDDATIDVGGMKVDAGEHGATFRKVGDVRLRGEATAREKRGVRALFLQVAGDHDARASVGYQAAGPKVGPLTVALIKWSRQDNEDLYKDVRELVRDNGGA